MKTKAWMTDNRSNPIKATTEAFKLAFSSGLQERNLDRQHTAERRQLAGERKREERGVAAKERAGMDQQTAGLRDDYAIARADHELKHGMAAAKLKAEWKQLNRDRATTRNEGGRMPTRSSDVGGGGGGQRRDPVTKEQLDRAFAALTQKGLAQDIGPPDTRKLTEKVLKALEQQREDRDAERGQKHGR